MKSKAGRNACLTISILVLIMGVQAIVFGVIEGPKRNIAIGILLLIVGFLGIRYRNAINLGITALFLLAVICFLIPLSQLSFWKGEVETLSHIEKDAKNGGYYYVTGKDEKGYPIYGAELTEKETAEHIKRTTGVAFESETQTSLYIVFLFVICFLLGLFPASLGIELLRSHVSNQRRTKQT